MQGMVVNVSSVGAITPNRSHTMTSYGFGKAAQDTLTKDPTFLLQLSCSRVPDAETLRLCCRARWSMCHRWEQLCP